MSLTDVKPAVELLNNTTLPALEEMLRRLVIIQADELHRLIERLDGIEITMTIKVPPRK